LILPLSITTNVSITEYQAIGNNDKFRHNEGIYEPSENKPVIIAAADESG
jgi:hypothetical protein